MDGMNRVYLLGNLGADPELRFTGNNTPVLNLRMATSEPWTDKNKEVQERTEWHNVVVFGPRGEALAKILTKGARIIVEGWLRTSSYEKDGIKRYKTEVVARDVHLAGRSAGNTDRVEIGGLGVPLSPLPPPLSNGAGRQQQELHDEIPY